MQTTEEKLTILTALFVVLFFGSMMMLSKDVRRSTGTAIEELVYEMPRPTKIFHRLFDLTGREIVRIVKGLPGKTMDLVKNNTKNQLKDSKDSKNPNGTKAAADAQAKKKESNTGTANNKILNKSKLGVIYSNIQMGGDVSGSPPSSPSPTKAEDEDIGATPIRQAPPAGDLANENPELKKREKQKNREAFWKDLLRREPTLANVAKLREALNVEEISATAYFEIMKDLLSNSKPESQSAGIFGLEGTQSLTSFNLLSQAFPNLTVENQASANQHFSTYAQQSRFPILQAALNVNSAPTVFKAGEMLDQAITQAKNQGNNNDRTPSGRNARSQPPPHTSAAYTQFVKTLEKLETNPEFADMARHLLAEISSLPKE